MVKANVLRSTFIKKKKDWKVAEDYEIRVKTRAPERWKRWERVPSQFEILAATFG